MSTKAGANPKDERIRGLAAKGLTVERIARKMGMDTEVGRARVREGLERLKAEGCQVACGDCGGSGYAVNCTEADRQRGDLWACLSCCGTGTAEEGCV